MGLDFLPAPVRPVLPFRGAPACGTKAAGGGAGAGVSTCFLSASAAFSGYFKKYP